MLAEPDTYSLDALATRGSAAALAPALSTGMPKGVINTQRMLTVSQDAEAMLWPFVERERPKILDWLPWEPSVRRQSQFQSCPAQRRHADDRWRQARGASVRANAQKYRGGAGQHPFQRAARLRPLAAALKQDDALRETYFRDLQLIFYPDVALPQTVWDDLRALSPASVDGGEITDKGYVNQRAVPVRRWPQPFMTRL